MDEHAMQEEANRIIAYHSPISQALTAERTSLESRLIPVSAYIVVACVEAHLRYPELIRRIDEARPAEQVGLAGHRPGSRINSVYLWSVPNFYLIGRKVMALLDPANDPIEPTWRVMDFWERAAMAFRGDGTRQAWDTGAVRPYGDDVLGTLTAGAVPITNDDDRARVKRFNATLVNYLFLLYFDTRVGAGDTGPYGLPDGRVLLVRDYYRIGHSPDFWWSDVARDVPYHNLTAALVLDGVEVRITDFGTSNTTPEDYLDRLQGFGLFTTDGSVDGSLRPVPLDEVDGLITAVRTAQAQHYRNIVAMSNDEKIRCGAYVYFSFLRPYAEVAGIADRLDWSVPRDIPEPLYQMLSLTRGENTSGVAGEDPYYAPIA